MPYPELWRLCLAERWYHLRLSDESFFQFRVTDEISYCFYESPVKAQSFADFALTQLGDGWEELTDELRDEYQEYLNSLPHDWPASPVRFDFSPHLYRAPCHPAAHVHFGYSSQIRIATRRVLTPEAFVAFVLRQYYPDALANLLDQLGPAYFQRRIRGGLEMVASEHWGEVELAEMYFE